MGTDPRHRPGFAANHGSHRDRYSRPDWSATRRRHHPPSRGHDDSAECEPRRLTAWMLVGAALLAFALLVVLLEGGRAEPGTAGESRPGERGNVLKIASVNSAVRRSLRCAGLGLPDGRRGRPAAVGQRVLARRVPSPAARWRRPGAAAARPGAAASHRRRAAQLRAGPGTGPSGAGPPVLAPPDAVRPERPAPRVDHHARRARRQRGHAVNDLAGWPSATGSSSRTNATRFSASSAAVFGCVRKAASPRSSPPRHCSPARPSRRVPIGPPRRRKRPDWRRARSSTGCPTPSASAPWTWRHTAGGRRR